MPVEYSAREMTTLVLEYGRSPADAPLKTISHARRLAEAIVTLFITDDWESQVAAMTVLLQAVKCSDNHSKNMISPEPQASSGDVYAEQALARIERIRARDRERSRLYRQRPEVKERKRAYEREYMRARRQRIRESSPE